MEIAFCARLSSNVVEGKIIKIFRLYNERDFVGVFFK